MGIQISEKGLSPMAVKALNNAKNKSQYLRDALEYYVRREGTIETPSDIKTELQEIKTLLRNLQFSCNHLSNSDTPVNVKNNPAAIANNPKKEDDEGQEKTKKTEAVKIPECYE